MSLCISNTSDFNNKKNRKTEINTLKIDPFFKIRDKMRVYLNNKYANKNNLKYQYIGLVMQNLIFNKSTHLVSVFKDYMITDYIEEFLKRYYKIYESKNKLPQFSLFYKNYLKFFCIPTMKNIFVNNLIHNRCEKKAEFFYNQNYKNKRNDYSSSDQDLGLCEDTDSSEEEELTENSEENLKKSIKNHNFFSSKIRQKIEKYTPINTSMVLPESGSKLKKDDSGLLQSNSNEESLVKIVNVVSKDHLFHFATLNCKKNNTQTLENKKIKKRISNNKIDFLLSDNHLKKKIINIKNNDDKNNQNEKIDENNDNNFENCNKKIKLKNKIKTNTLKKLGSQKIKILLNKNNGILKSKSNKKIIKKNGLWNLLKERESINFKSNNTNNEINDINEINNICNNKENFSIVNKNINKNSNISYISLCKNKIANKISNKLSPDEKNSKLVQNKRKYFQKNFNKNNLNNNSNFATFEKSDIKKSSYNYIGLPKYKKYLNNNIKNFNKNIIDSLLNKIKNKEINSVKKRTLNQKKIFFKKKNKKSNYLTRNGNNKIGLFSLTNNYIFSNNSKLNITNSNKNNNNNKNSSSNNELRSKSNKMKNLKFLNSPSSILDFLKMTTFQHKMKKKINNSNQVTINKSNHIHNVNININNQINIRFNHLKDLKSFIGNSKKNKFKKSTISRNKNRSLDFHTINQNLINNNNYSTFFSNYKKEKSRLRLIKNNKLYGIKSKNIISRNDKLIYNMESLLSNNKDKKIKTNYHYFFN